MRVGCVIKKKNFAEEYMFNEGLLVVMVSLFSWRD